MLAYTCEIESQYLTSYLKTLPDPAETCSKDFEFCIFGLRCKTLSLNKNEMNYI